MGGYLYNAGDLFLAANSQLINQHTVENDTPGFIENRGRIDNDNAAYLLNRGVTENRGGTIRNDSDSTLENFVGFIVNWSGSIENTNNSRIYNWYGAFLDNHALIEKRQRWRDPQPGSRFHHQLRHD